MKTAFHYTAPRFTVPRQTHIFGSLIEALCLLAMLAGIVMICLASQG